MGKGRKDKNLPLWDNSSNLGNRDDFPPPSPVFSGWEEASVTSNQTKILNIDLEELLREDSDNNVLSDPSLRTQSNVHNSSKENNTENPVDEFDKTIRANHNLQRI